MKRFSFVSQKRALLAKKTFSVALLVGLFFQPIAPAFFYGGFFISTVQAADESENSVTAEVPENTPEEKEASEETTEPTDFPQEEVAPTAPEESVAEEEEAKTSETPAEEAAPTEEKTSETVKEAPEVWDVEGEKATTTSSVLVGTKYVAPQNEDVSVTFTKLPDTAGTLTIEEITLTQEQIATTGAVSDKAYDITSSMENGSFEYELTLPIPEGKEAVQVKYAETVEKLNNAETVAPHDVKTEGDSVTAELNHFTVFVVTGVDNSGSCAGAPVLVNGGDTCYTTLQAAIDAAAPGSTIELTADINTSSQVTINKALTIDGKAKTLNSNFSKNSNSNNSAIGILGTSGVTIKNLTLNGAGGTNLHGINVYQSTGVLLDAVSSNNYRSGVVVNSSIVTVNNIATSGNTWHGINVDSTGLPAALTINGTSDHTDFVHMYVDNTTEPVTVTDTNNQYTTTENTFKPNDRVYTLAPPDTTIPAVPSAIYNERTSGTVIASGGATDEAQFTFNLSSDVDTTRYQLKYWNDIPGSIFKEATPWNPSDLASHSSSLGVYNDEFTQGEGTHYFAFSACDGASNCSGYGTPFTVTYDMTAPTVPGQIGWTTENPPAGSDYTGGSDFDNYKTCGQSLNYSPVSNIWAPSTDASGVTTYEREVYSPDDATLIYAHSVNTNYAHGGGAVDGQTYWVRVRAVDAAGNKSDWTPKCASTYDATAPASPAVTVNESDGDVIANGGLTNSYGITINWNAVAGATSYEYRYSNSIPGNAYNAPNYYTVTTTSTSLAGVFNQGDGLHHIEVQACDAAGNCSPWSTQFNINYDGTVPSLPTHLSPADNTFTTTALQTSIGWTDSTDANAVKYEYQAANSNAINGDGSFVSPIYTSSPLLTTSQIATPGTPEGVYYWHVRAQDAAGNWSAWTNPWKITVDNSAPTVDIVFPTPGPAATSFQVVFSEDVNQGEATNPANYFLNNWPGAGGSGDLAGDATVTYDVPSKTATVQMTNPGWYVSSEQEWGVQNIHDLAGNLQVVNPYEETSTPMVAPVTTDSGTDTNWHNTPVTVTLTCDDGASTVGSGCKTTYYTTDGTNPTTASAQGNSVVVSAEGVTTIKYFSVDNAGNAETVKTAANTVKIDTAAPTQPTFTAPANNLFTNVNAVTLTWSGGDDVPAGVKGYTIRYTFVPMGGGATVNWTSGLIENGNPGTHSGTYGHGQGTYTIFVSTTDNAGNMSPESAPLVLNYDATAPNLSSQTTYSGWYNTNQTSTFNYEDDFGVVSGTPVTCEITTEGANQTCTQATVNVCDAAGNCNTEPVTSNGANIDKSTNSVSYSIDPTTPDGDSNWYVTAPIISLTATDTMSGVDHIEYRLNGGTWTTYGAPFALADGTWTIEYRYFDSVGNESTTGSASAKVDTTNPDEVDNLDAQYREIQDDIKLDWDVNDDDIDQVYIYRGSSRTFNTNSGNKIGENDDNDTTFNDGDVAFGKTYYYKLVSLDDAGNRSGSKVIRVEMPETADGTATVTDEGVDVGGTGTGGDGEVLGAQTTPEDGVAQDENNGATTSETNEDGTVLGASTENGTTNGLMDLLKKYSWWWLIILLIIGYTGYKYYSKKQNPLA